MTKNKTTASIVLGISLNLYNLIFFMFPTTKDASFWISYTFGMIAILLQIGIVFLAWGKARTLKSKFFGIPILIVGYRYLIIQLISSGVFLSLAIIPVRVTFYIPFIIDFIILSVCVVLISTIDVAKDEINRVEEKIQGKVFYIKELQADIEIFVSKVDDNSLKKILTELAEKIRYSDPMSYMALSSLENDISTKSSKLKDSILENDYNLAKSISGEISEMIEERNKKVKLMK